MFIRVIDFDILDKSNDNEAMRQARLKVEEYRSQGLKVVARLREKENGSTIQISVYDNELYRYTVRDTFKY